MLKETTNERIRHRADLFISSLHFHPAFRLPSPDAHFDPPRLRDFSRRAMIQCRRRFSMLNREVWPQRRTNVHRILASSLLVFISFASLRAVAGEFQDDLKARRGRAMERLGQEAMLVLWSAPVQVYSRDVNYEYRQDSNLYYLTGIDQEQTILVLMPGNKTRREFLFIRPRDSVREHWERSEEHTSELQSHHDLVCRLLL